MDHSQHSIHNHDHHSIHTGAHDHEAIEAASSSTTLSPVIDLLDNVGIGVVGAGIDAVGAGVGAGLADEHNHHHTMHNIADSMSNGDMSGTMHHMMSMSFHFGCNETILFSWWKIDNNLELIGSMLAIFVMALLYEGLKYYRELLFWRTYNLLEYRPVTGPQRNPEEAQQRATPTTSATPVQYVGEVIHKQPPSMCSLNHILQTLLHILQVTLSFLLMLIFMTYNVWLCIAVVLGAAVGYYLFCWKKSVIVDVTEHCH